MSTRSLGLVATLAVAVAIAADTRTGSAATATQGGRLSLDCGPPIRKQLPTTARIVEGVTLGGVAIGMTQCEAEEAWVTAVTVPTPRGATQIWRPYVGAADHVFSIDIVAAADVRGWVGDLGKPSWRP